MRPAPNHQPAIAPPATLATLATQRQAMDDAEEIERRLNAGEWLSPGEVGVLFGRDRTTIHRWLGKGWARYRETFGGYRECNPEDIRARLAAWRAQGS